MDTAIQNLFKGARARNIPKGKIVIYEGHAVDKIYYILSGYVKVYTIVGTATQRIPFVYQAGDVFPLTTFLSGGGIARFFYEAMTPVRALCVTSKKLESKIIGNLELAEELIGHTSAIDEQFIRRVNDLVGVKDPLSKVKNLLIFLSGKEGPTSTSVQLDLHLSARDVANMCGISREEAMRQLNFLKSHEIISTSGSITINTEKLHSL
jgi:CRP/FNR family cyclic AMP-dependent transcriptional regulator